MGEGGREVGLSLLFFFFLLHSMCNGCMLAGLKKQDRPPFAHGRAPTCGGDILPLKCLNTI